MPPRTSPLWLPIDALRLAGRFVLPLALLFSLGQLLRYLLVVAASELQHGDHRSLRELLVGIVFVLIVLVAMAVMVAMLSAVRPGLRAVGGGDLDEETLVAALGRTLLPFAIVYFAWNLFYEDLSLFIRVDFLSRYKRGGGEVFADVGLWVALGVAGVALALRVLSQRWYERRGAHVAGILVAFFEACFALFAIFSVLRLWHSAIGWLTSRVAWRIVADAVAAVDSHIPGWHALRGFGGLAQDALLLPFLWLIIAAVVYGADIEANRAVVTGTLLEPLAERVESMRPSRRGLLAVGTADLRDKYAPVLLGGRMIGRSGIPVFAVFALCYVLAGHAAQACWQGVTGLIGPAEARTWHVMIEPIDFGRDLIREVLRVAVLAATVDLVMARLSERTAAPGGDGEPGPGGPEPESRRTTTPAS